MKSEILELFDYRGKLYPDYIRRGNAVAYIIPIAQKFCQGGGLDIGGTPDWHLPGAAIINPLYTNFDAYHLPIVRLGYDYIFSSHCLEHLENYVKALELWCEVLRPGGQLFLYLPHPEMRYWLPQNCTKHLHRLEPVVMVELLQDLGFKDVFYSERDLYWSFAVTGRKKP